jgi:hypothetical protein
MQAIFTGPIRETQRTQRSYTRARANPRACSQKSKGERISSIKHGTALGL